MRTRRGTKILIVVTTLILVMVAIYSGLQILESAVFQQAPETERLQVKDTRVRMPVRVAEYVPDSKADRSRFTDVSLREALITSSQPYMQS